MLDNLDALLQNRADVLGSGHWKDTMIEEHAMHQLCSVTCGTAAAQSVSAGNGANYNHSAIGVLCKLCYFSMHLYRTVPETCTVCSILFRPAAQVIVMRENENREIGGERKNLYIISSQT